MSIKSKVIIGFRILNIVVFFVLIYLVFSPIFYCPTREDATFATYKTELESVNMNIDINKSVKFNIDKIEDKNFIRTYNKICFDVIKDNFKYPEIARKIKKKYCKDSYRDMVKRMLIYNK